MFAGAVEAACAAVLSVPHRDVVLSLQIARVGAPIGQQTVSSSNKFGLWSRLRNTAPRRRQSLCNNTDIQGEICCGWNVDAFGGRPDHRDGFWGTHRLGLGSFGIKRPHTGQHARQLHHPGRIALRGRHSGPVNRTNPSAGRRQIAPRFLAVSRSSLAFFIDGLSRRFTRLWRSRCNGPATLAPLSGRP